MPEEGSTHSIDWSNGGDTPKITTKLVTEVKQDPSALSPADQLEWLKANRGDADSLDRNKQQQWHNINGAATLPQE